MDKEPVRVLTPDEMYETKWWKSAWFEEWRRASNIRERYNELPCDTEQKEVN